MECRVDPIEAVRNGWIELWYQPKVDAQALTMLGAEALLRVRHPVVGILPPSLFIQMPEARLRTLCDTIINQALTDCAAFVAERRPIEIAINLPMAYLRDKHGIDHFCRHLPDHPHFPGLIVEIESADVARNWSLVKANSQKLRYSKVVLSVDHVGARSTWLRDIREVPFVEIKIDQNLVRGCATDKPKRVICKEICDLARSFGARSIAEGVEAWPDALAIRDLGCAAIRGALFAKPASREEFLKSCWTDTGQHLDNRFPRPSPRPHEPQQRSIVQ